MKTFSTKFTKIRTDALQCVSGKDVARNVSTITKIAQITKITVLTVIFGLSIMSAVAQTPVTIDISTLGGVDVSNVDTPEEPQWNYNESEKTLYLTSNSGNYTLTGTNADLGVYTLSDGVNLTLNNVHITTATLYLTPVFVERPNFLTLTLIGDNYLEATPATQASCLVFYYISGTITSSSGGTLKTKAPNFSIYVSGLTIDGNANVSVERNGYDMAINSTYDKIRMSDAAKLTLINNFSVDETHKFEKLNAASTLPWHLTNATTSDPLTDPIINVTVASGQTGTIERKSETPDIYTITVSVNNASWGSITPAGNATGEVFVEEGDDLTFTITPANGYEIHSVSVNGSSIGAVSTYTFTNVHANGTIEVVFAATSGIVETQCIASLQVYPNPTTGQLRITNYEAAMGEIGVYDISGRVVETHNYASLRTDNTATLDISHLPAGVYFLRVGNETAKVVKE